MKLLAKISTGLILTGIFTLSFATGTFAQSALDDIKAKLESEGIEVIDYSTPANEWGSIPSDWQNYLKRQGFESLARDHGSTASNCLSMNLESHYIGSPSSLIPLRRELARYEAIKSRLTNRDQIASIDALIEGGRIVAEIPEIASETVPDTDVIGVKEEITAKENEIKDDIRNIIRDAGDAGLNIDEGINLIFREVEFYFNYSKWGGLPTRIIILLEDAGHQSLSAIASVITSQEQLETSLGNIEGLSQDDIELIYDRMMIIQAGASGESQINQITRSIANTIKNLLIGIAVLWIIYAGARMVFAQGDENIITEQKRALLYAGIGLVAVLLVDRGIDYLYGPAGVVREELVRDEGFSNEVYGLVNFIKALIGTIAILFLVISGIRILFAGGEEDTISKQKKSLIWVGVGLILIAIDKILVDQIFVIPSQYQSDQIRTSNVTAVINTFGSVLQFILGFVGLVAFAALIYGAATMVMNYGNDEMVQKSKRIIRNAIIGIVIILSAYAIVATLVVFR